jgi:hypothetical protein
MKIEKIYSSLNTILLQTNFGPYIIQQINQT